MNKGSIVMIEFTGKDASTGKVFDTTDEKVAKENGLWNERAVFRPVPVIVGEGEVIKGIDEELEKMSEGEEREIKIEPAKAFGERNPELVGIVPLSSFVKNKMNPYVGMVVEINGSQGKVQSISGGRVRVDFNNSMAGKTLEYKLKVVKELKSKEEKFSALLDKYLPFREKVEFRINGDEALVKLPKSMPKELEPLKAAFAKLITDKLKEIKKVSYVESFDVKKENAEGKVAEEEKWQNDKEEGNKTERIKHKEHKAKKQPHGKEEKLLKK